MDDVAIQNLEFLRRLIAETREPSVADVLRLRMLQDNTMGTGQVEAQGGDR